jgi:hypothetical protein
MEVVISKSSKPAKKYQASSGGRTIFFGQTGYSDYTMHRDELRKENYIKRHGAQQDWSKKNIMTPGFMSRYVLWEEPTVRQSIQKLSKRYKDVTFKFK